MSDFFSDFTDSLFGQQATPKQTIIPTRDLLNQTYSELGAQVPNVLAYNKALAPGLTDIQLGVQNQIFGPAANQLQKNTYQSILDNLNLGGSIPPELQDLITTNTLQSNTRSGLGTSDAGRLFGARSLMSAGLDLGQQRRNEALGAVSRLPSSSYQFQPQGLFSPEAVSGDIRGVQSAQDEYANLQEDIRRQNFTSLINTGGRILGGVVGGVAGSFLGNPAAGVAGGQAIGGSFFSGSGVAGQQSRSGASQSGNGGNPFSSVLSFMGGGGGKFVPGAGGRPDAVTAGGLPFGGAFMGGA